MSLFTPSASSCAAFDDHSHALPYRMNRYRNHLLFLIFFICVFCTLFLILFYRCLQVLDRPKKPTHLSVTTQNGNAAPKPKHYRGHLLIVLGSGGHTAEMISILTSLGAEYITSRFHRRTWVVSSGDSFSAARAQKFEEQVLAPQISDHDKSKSSDASVYSICTVHRARRIHQSLYTTPISALQCLYSSLQVLRGTHSDFKPTVSTTTSIRTPYPYPDLILVNGPATSVILVLASFLLRFFGLAPLDPDIARGERRAMRTVYVESWARVSRLSLSGRIVERLGLGRVLVQWESLARESGGVVRSAGGGGGGGSIGEEWMNRRVEYVGPVVA